MGKKSIYIKTKATAVNTHIVCSHPLGVVRGFPAGAPRHEVVEGRRLMLVVIHILVRARGCGVSLAER